MKINNLSPYVPHSFCRYGGKEYNEKQQNIREI